MSGPEHTAPTLPFYSWKQRPQSPDACPRPHSGSASESAGKPVVPNTQDAQALRPRRKAWRPGAGHRLARPMGRGYASSSNSGTSGPPHKGRGFQAGRDLTGCWSEEGGTSRLKGVGVASLPQRRSVRHSRPLCCDAGVSGGGAEPNLRSTAPSGDDRGRGRVLGGAAPRPARSRCGGSAGRARPRHVSAAGAGMGARDGAPGQARGVPGGPDGREHQCAGGRASPPGAGPGTAGEGRSGLLWPGRPRVSDQPSAANLRPTGRAPARGAVPAGARYKRSSDVCPRAPPAKRRPPQWQPGFCSLCGSCGGVMGVSCAAGPEVTPFLAPGWAAACVSPDLLFLGTVT